MAVVGIRFYNGKAKDRIEASIYLGKITDKVTEVVVYNFRGANKWLVWLFGHTTDLLEFKVTSNQTRVL